MYHEEMHVKFEYGCCLIIIGEVIPFGLRKLLENDSFLSFRFISDGWMDSKEFGKEMQVTFEYGCGLIIIGEVIAPAWT